MTSVVLQVFSGQHTGMCCGPISYLRRFPAEPCTYVVLLFPLLKPEDGAQVKHSITAFYPVSYIRNSVLILYSSVATLTLYSCVLFSFYFLFSSVDLFSLSFCFLVQGGSGTDVALGSRLTYLVHFVLY